MVPSRVSARIPPFVSPGASARIPPFLSPGVSPRRSRGHRCRASFETGFTLIEILVVISIIALLGSLTAAGIFWQREHTYVGIATAEVSRVALALDAFVSDEGTYPAADRKPDPSRNDYPELLRALTGVRRPLGPGGRNSPYLSFKEKNVFVRDEGSGEYRPATRLELQDDAVDKYVVDPWGNPYVYRLLPDRHTGGARVVGDILSLGPNGLDDGDRDPGEGDDIRS